jgi:hypothetical protein
MHRPQRTLTPEQKFALSSTSVRTPVGASRPQEQGNPVQAPQAANMMKQRARGDYENFERGLKGEESSNRSRYGQVRGLVNTNAQAPAQPNTPRVAVQSAPRPDLSGGPRQPMGGLGQPMGGPGFGGPGQLPPNKGRRKPGMGSGMGRARRATGLARRAKKSCWSSKTCTKIKRIKLKTTKNKQKTIMAYKQKGSPFQRNFGIGSPAKQMLKPRVAPTAAPMGAPAAPPPPVDPAMIAQAAKAVKGAMAPPPVDPGAEMPPPMQRNLRMEAASPVKFIGGMRRAKRAARPKTARPKTAKPMSVGVGGFGGGGTTGSVNQPTTGGPQKGIVSTTPLPGGDKEE